MSQLQNQLAQVKTQIQQACQQHQRQHDDVHLLAVSKTHPIEAVEALYHLGQRAFGENYLQEALAKIEALKHLKIDWHFIGHVQRNKTKALAENFNWVHGVDRLIIAERLSAQRPAHLDPLNICIQVNIDGQESKDGCHPSEVAELVAKISALPKICLRGLMVIPAPNNSLAFKDTQVLFQQVKIQHAHPEDWDTLSMGMSADLDAAIAGGSTMVRIGTALFGARDGSI